MSGQYLPELEKKLRLTVQTGLLLTKTFDLEAIVQSATDAGLELCGAEFGAFFYNVLNEKGESYLLYTLSGVDREKFARFPMPRNTAVFAPTFGGVGIVRSGDITKDPRYGNNAPHHGMPQGHLPVRSYLAVPVMAQSGEVLGGLFYGHAKPNRFEESQEELVAAIAAQAAIAIENARLRDQLTRKIGDLEQAQLAQKKDAARLAELAAIVNSSGDAILSADNSGNVTSWNLSATKLFGFSEGEMVGNSVYKFLPLDRAKDETDILERVRQGEYIEPFETVRITNTGARVDVLLTASPLYDESGRIVGLSKILRDISSRKRMERSLVQSEKIAATASMAAAIAHEVNNPLEAVTNLLFLTRSLVQDSQALHYLTEAESELGRVAHITKQTLGFYRETANPSPIRLSTLVSDAIKIYEPRFSGAHVSIHLSLLSTRELTMRKGEITQAVSNILSNAFYAMPDGGQLEITTYDVEDPAPGVHLRIRDTGIGIPPELLARVFEAFFTTRSPIATGIGLHLAQQFLEGHGGTIQIRSSIGVQDHGTEVNVFLPLR